MSLNKPLCLALFLSVAIGLGVALYTEPQADAWWSVIYPDFYSADLQRLPQGQEDRIEIRWRTQELWQQIFGGAADASRTLSSPLNTPIDSASHGLTASVASIAPGASHLPASVSPSAFGDASASTVELLP